EPSAPKPSRRQPSATVNPLWSGDVESIPYPFRFGTEPHLTHFDFDYTGQWLLTASGAGILHLWKLDGSTQEILPCPCWVEVLKNIHSVLGVKAGFVVVFKHSKCLVAAHYDFVRRQVATFEFSPHNAERIECRYVQEHHSVMFSEAHRIE